MTSALLFLKVQGEKLCSGIKLMCDVSTKITFFLSYFEDKFIFKHCVCLRLEPEPFKESKVPGSGKIYQLINSALK